jgi:phospholipid/cholesterol/gamma-HCH transport system substrate-binding protein
MYKNSDFLAGAFVIGAFALMLWATMIIGGHKGAFIEIFTGKENRILTVKFENISGLEVNHGVRVQGHKFGKVIKINLDKAGLLLVDVELNSPQFIYEGYNIEIKDESVLGGKAVYIDIGNKNGKQIQGLYTDNAPILNGKSGANLMAEGGNLLADNREDIRKIVLNVKEISEHIKAISVKANEGDGVVAKVLNDKELAENLKTTMANINLVVAKIKNGEGFLGKLISDDSLYKDVQKLIKDAQATLEDLREQAPITTFAGTIMGAF